CSTDEAYDLEQVDHAEHEAVRLAVRALCASDIARGVDGVRVDVERICRSPIVVQLDVTGVDLRALRERIRVAEFPLAGSGVGPSRQPADALPVRSAATAIAGTAIER